MIADLRVETFGVEGRIDSRIVVRDWLLRGSVYPGTRSQCLIGSLKTAHGWKRRVVVWLQLIVAGEGMNSCVCKEWNEKANGECATTPAANQCSDH